MKNNNDCYRGVQRNVVFDLEGELVFGAFAVVRAVGRVVRCSREMGGEAVTAGPLVSFVRSSRKESSDALPDGRTTDRGVERWTGDR